MLNGKENFVNFKVHTQYSICEGAVKIDDLSEFCKNKKIKSIGICDSYNLCGALEFAEKISKSGTQPIIGTQINFSIDQIKGKLPLFAKTQTGYTNLTKLSSKSYLDSSALSGPYCNFEDLLNKSSGIIVLSGSIRCLLGNLFNKGLFNEIDQRF